MHEGEGSACIGGRVSMHEREGSACLLGHGVLGGFADEWRVHCGKARGFQSV